MRRDLCDDAHNADSVSAFICELEREREREREQVAAQAAAACRVNGLDADLGRSVKKTKKKKKKERNEKKSAAHATHVLLRLHSQKVENPTNNNQTRQDKKEKTTKIARNGREESSCSDISRPIALAAPSSLVPLDSDAGTTYLKISYCLHVVFYLEI